MLDPPLLVRQTLQLVHYLYSLKLHAVTLSPLTPFDFLYGKTNPLKHALSSIYAIFGKPKSVLNSCICIELGVGPE